METAPNNEPRQQIILKRVDSILGTYQKIAERFPEIFGGCYLEPELVREAVESYADDREAYMHRHKIKLPHRIMFHKVAGMTAAAISKYRPVQFSGPAGSPRTGGVFQNEMLALWHGLAVCAEPYLPSNRDQLRSAIGSAEFPGWQREFVSLLHRHPDSAQGFIVIFYTFCMNYFPRTIEPSRDGVILETEG